MTETASGTTRGTAPSPHLSFVPTAMAALAVVLHRRSAHERVVLRCMTRIDGLVTDAVVPIDLAGDPWFGRLVDRLTEELTALSGNTLTSSTEVEVDAVFVFGIDAGELREPIAAVPVVTWAASGELTVTAPGGQEIIGPLRDQIAVAMDAEPARRVSVLRLATEEEQRRLEKAEDGAAPEPARLVPEVVASYAAATPDAVAIRCAGRELTYQELNESAQRRCAVLKAAGVRPGDVVGVLLGRSPELIATLLAVLRAGAAYLALEPEDGPVRHELLLRDADAKLLIVEAGEGTIGLGPPVMSLTETMLADVCPEDGAIADVTPDDIAYVSYTSGSTGTPKGVAVQHRGICRLGRRPNWIDVRTNDVFLEFAPVSFDASTVEIWLPLLNGASVAVLTRGPVELDRLSHAVRAEGVTVLLLTTGLFHQMVSAHPETFDGVRHVLTGGDVVSPRHVERLLTEHPHLLFTNGYGPTENTSFTTCWTSTVLSTSERVPIGVPISGTSIAVLDPELVPVPEGVCGELFAGGDGLARGYVGRPAATAERFLPNPYSNVPGARLYRTGDLVRRLPDGTVEFVGRVDDQVKIQGYRVEPGEIEMALTRHAEVEHAVVVVQAQQTGGKRLLAYVVPSRDVDASTLGLRLRDELKAELPPYLVPWAVLVHDDLPLTRNGKIDRRALPVANRLPRTLWNDFVAPRYTAEADLAEMWRELLNTEPVGVEDDFFELGGHSLLAAELIGRIQREFGVDIPARTIYLRPTIAELAEELGSRLRRASALSAEGDRDR